jgi:hypothetical protein
LLWAIFPGGRKYFDSMAALGRRIFMFAGPRLLSYCPEMQKKFEYEKKKHFYPLLPKILTGSNSIFTNNV